MNPRTLTPDTHTKELLIAQQTFRAIMEAMSRPGSLQNVPMMFSPTLDNAHLESIVHMLIDSHTTFCAMALNQKELNEQIMARNYGRAACAKDADFAVIFTSADKHEAASALKALSGGSEISPEKGATAIIECESLSEEVSSSSEPRAGASNETLIAVEASGPGIENTCRFMMTEVDSWWIEARAARCDDFPQGIDIILVDALGRVIAVPRTTVIILPHIEHTKHMGV